jgi:hypothetical protein
VVSASHSTFYRVLRSRIPERRDFVSNAVKYAQDIDRGRRRRVPDTGDGLHMWSGVSVFSSLGEARATARQYPNLGAFIGLVQIPPNQGRAIRVERTSDATEHYTIWARPDRLAACVDNVVAVEGPTTEGER